MEPKKYRLNHTHKTAHCDDLKARKGQTCEVIAKRTFEAAAPQWTVRFEDGAEFSVAPGFLREVYVPERTLFSLKADPNQKSLW